MSIENYNIIILIAMVALTVIAISGAVLSSQTKKNINSLENVNILADLRDKDHKQYNISLVSQNNISHVRTNFIDLDLPDMLLNKETDVSESKEYIHTGIYTGNKRMAIISDGYYADDINDDNISDAINAVCSEIQDIGDAYNLVETRVLKNICISNIETQDDKCIVLTKNNGTSDKILLIGLSKTWDNNAVLLEPLVDSAILSLGSQNDLNMYRGAINE